MATDLVMPTLDTQQPHNLYIPNTTPTQRPLHQRALSYQVPPTQTTPYTIQRISPLSTSNSPSHSPSSATTAPTSPTKSYHARQVRPLYIPAVLRPTEFPSKPIPTSARDVKSASGDSTPFGSFTRRTNSFISLAGLTGAVQKLSRRSTADSGKGLSKAGEDREEGETLDIELFPDVTGEPTRRHWKPDPNSTICDDPTCKRSFNYFTRRHHCRRCGNIFCDAHSSYAIPLDQDANYNPRGTCVRSCQHCYSQFQAWRSANSSQNSSSANSEIATGVGPNGMPAGSQNFPIGMAINGLPGAGQQKQQQDVANSVPRDWNWSTF